MSTFFDNWKHRTTHTSDSKIGITIFCVCSFFCNGNQKSWAQVQEHDKNNSFQVYKMAHKIEYTSDEISCET